MKLSRCRRALLSCTGALSLFLFAACDGSELSPVNGGLADSAVTDTGTDSSQTQTDVPTTPPDSQPPTETTVPTDIQPDVPPDVPTDTQPDIEPDVPTDTQPDIEPDVPTDADPDIDPDVPTDADPDSEVDAPTDTTPDTTPTCGNNIKEGTELCDGTDLGAATCASQGFDAGVLTCAGSCNAFVTTACTNDGEAPAGWTCDDEWYFDSDCDCACGIKDPACASTTDAAECDTCASCDELDCSVAVDPSNTTICLGGAPTGWTCDPDYYNDDDCDCGCGIKDPVCTSTTNVDECEYCIDCPGSGLDCDQRVDPTDTTSCLGEGECGNGIIEVGEDCEGTNLGGADCTDAGNFDGGTLTCGADCQFVTTACTIPEVPAGWTCDPDLYNDGGCDCGCGVQDIDCSGTTDADECEYCDECGGSIFGCDPSDVDPTDTTQCAGEVEVPAGWTCDPDWYSDGDCDCGCGVKDPVCNGTTDATECDYCIDCPGSGSCSTRLTPNNTTLCLGATQCGNNTVETGEDCEGTNIGTATCESLGYTGGTLACNAASCEFDTTGCTKPPVPAGWTCNPNFWADGDCDCGCGVKDFDCENTNSLTTCDICNCGGPFTATDCSPYVNATDTTQCRTVPLGENCTNPIEAAGDTFNRTINTCDYLNDFSVTSEAAGCESNTSATANSRDAVIHFVPATSGTYIAKSTVTGTAFDGIINVVAGICPATGTYGTCLDGGDAEPPTAEFSAVAGQSYYVIVDGYSTGCGSTAVSIAQRCDRTPGFCDALACDAVDNCGVPCGCAAGAVCTAGTCQATPGESCAAPLPLTQTGNTWTGSGTLVGATDNQVVGTCPKLESNTFTPTGVGTADQVWSFTSTEAGSYRIDLTRGPAGDIYYYVFKGATCDNASCLGFVEAVTSGTETQDFVLEANQLYTIVVESYSTSSTLSTYTLNVTRQCARTAGFCDALACDTVDNCGVPCGCASGQICTAGTCQAEPGETCAAPKPLVQTGNTWTGASTLVGATDDQAVGTCPKLESNTFTPTGVGTADEAWSFTSAGAGSYRIDLTRGPAGDIYYYVYKGATCDNASCLGYVEAVTSGTETQDFTLEANQLYTIIVESYSTSSTLSTYTLTVTSLCQRTAGFCDALACNAVDNCGVPCGCTGGLVCEAGTCVTPDEADYDSCGTAGALTLGATLSVDTCDLESDYTFAGAGCTEPTDDAPDAVFSFTATTTGEYAVNVLGDGLIDPVLNIVVASTCPAPVTTCTDNSDGTTDDEHLSVELDAGETVWIFVAGYEWINGNDCGEIDVSVTAVVPEDCDDTTDNDGDGDIDCADDDCDAFPACVALEEQYDVCSTAGQLVLDVPVTYDSCDLDIDYDFDAIGCLEADVLNPDAVFSYTATTTGNHTFLVDGNDPVVNVVIANACPAEITECDGAVDTTTEPETVVVPLTAGETVWLFVTDYDFCGETTVTLDSVPCTPTPESACQPGQCDRTDSCGNACSCGAGFACNTTTDTCEAVAAAPGDSCANPIEIAAETFNRTIDTCLYLPNFGQAADAGGCQANSNATTATTSKDAVFHFVPPTAGTYTVTATAATFDGLLNVVSGATCPGATLTSCIAGADEPEPMTVTFTATAGGSYFIILDGYTATDCGSSTVTITKQCVPTPESACGTNSCDRNDSCGTPCTCTGGNVCNTTTDTCEAPPPVQNDTCALPGTLALGTPVAFNSCALNRNYQFGTTGNVDLNGCQENGAAREGVFGYTATTAGSYRITLTGTASADAVINVVDGACPAASTTPQTCIASADLTFTGEVETTTVTLAAGQHINVFASSYGTTCSGTTNNLTLVVRPTTELTCTGGVDDDGDTFIDCADSDCAGNAACAGVENCTDGVDNDGDTFADCADSDCAALSQCRPGNTCQNPIALTAAADGKRTGSGSLAAPATNEYNTTGCAALAGGAATGATRTDVDQVFSFTVPVSATYRIAVNPTAGDVYWALRSGTCANTSTCLGVRDDAAASSGPETADVALTAGTSYFLFVEAYNAAAQTTFTVSVTPTTEIICNDNVTNDADALVDCLDPDCEGNAACAGIAFPEICTDGRDNDLDTLTDCADTVDCGASPQCVSGNTCNRPFTTTTAANGQQSFSGNLAAPTTHEFSTLGCTALGTGTQPSATDTDLDQVVAFTVPVSTSYNIVVTPTAGDLYWYIRTGAVCSTTATCLGSVNHGSTGAEAQTIALTAGTQYFLVVEANNAAAQVAYTGTITPTTEISCTDGVTNDADALVDCLDPDCEGNAACTGVAFPEICTDGRDNDLDTFTDCADSDCSAAVDCVPFETCGGRGTLAVGVTTSIATCSLTRNYSFTGSNGCKSNSSAKDAVVAFTAPAAGTYRLSVATTTSTVDPVVNVLGTATCPAAQTTTAQTCVASADVGVNGETENLTLTLAAGDTRFIFVSSFGTDATDCGNMQVLVRAATELSCTGGVDEDGDTFVDCLDTDCATNPACIAAPVEICDDNIDNDGDTFVDCADSGCASFSACLEGNSCEVPFDLDVDPTNPASFEGSGNLAPLTVTDDFEPMGCGEDWEEFYLDTGDVDQVFAFTVPTAGEYFIGVDSIGDVYWYLRQGAACESSTCVIAVDDELEDNIESANVNLVPGTQYYLVVESYDVDGRDPFDVLIELVPPTEGDSCVQPFTLTAAAGGGLEGDGDLSATGVGDDFSFNSCTAALDPSSVFISGTNTPDEVFAFTVATTGRYVITVAPETGADTAYALFSGGTCASATCVGYMDNEGAGDDDVAEVTLTAGVNYYLIVDTFSLASAGEYLVMIDPVPVVATPVTLVGWNFGATAAAFTLASTSGVALNNGKLVSETASGTPGAVSGSVGQAANVNGWDAGIGTKAWIADFSTTGYSNIRLVSWAQMGSNTGPANFRVDYSLDGTTWTPVSTAPYNVGAAFTTYGALTLPAAANNKATVKVRWVVTSTVSINNGTVASTGTNRIDEIVFEGTPTP